MLYQHFEKRRRVLLHGGTDRSTNVFQDLSENDQYHSSIISSLNCSDTGSISSSDDEEDSEQESSDHHSTQPEPLGWGTKPNARMKTMHSQSIKALFGCSFCDRHFESRYSRNQHEREDHHDSDLSKIFQCSFCDGHFESSLHRNEHEKQHKPRLLKHVCAEMGCDRRFTNKDGLKRHVQSVS
jgi:hypothetical protein